jgi:osmotically-inducible protein OsmY
MKTDNDLHKDVLETLGFDPLLDASNVAIAVKDGVVTLRGEVASYAELWAAERATKNVAGVRAVAQEIKVVLPRQHVRDDADIAAAAANSLQWDAIVPDGVKVKVANGWITLSGETKWQYQRKQAESVVRYLNGVQGVTNMIVVKTNPTTYDVSARIQNAFYRHAGIDASRVSVEVNDRAAILHGTVGTIAEREDAEDSAWMADGVDTVHNEIIVDPELSRVGLLEG